MKKKLSSKKCIALILAVVMIVTSVPLMMTEAIDEGAYDPAPYFSEEAIKQGADAWVDDDGNIQIEFPSATPVKTFKGEDTTIAFYILELIDMGAKDAVHSKAVLAQLKVTGTSATFKASDIGTFDFENKRYSVTITAVDSENWFSQPIYTTVTSIPASKIDPEKFHYFSTSDTAVREMATFDGETDSDNTATTTGNALLYMGPAAETGTEDLTDNVGDTSALRFIMNDMPSGTQTFYTSYSRETWDFKGAEEVWYWLDFSNINIQGLAFNLGAQCKDVTGWADGENIDVSENEVIQYSTKATTKSGYTGETPYVYVQREDAGWDKVMMTNGTIDLADFKGYVRIPVRFFCSINSTYVTTINSNLGTNVKNQVITSTNNPFASSSDLRPKTQANGDAYVASLQASSPILADAAGTPITEALMLQYRKFNCAEHIKLGISVGEMDGWNVGYMPAAAIGSKDDDSLYTATTDAKRATVDLSAGTITRTAETYRAIEDLKTVGFSFENCTSDSLQNSFYVDNIFFYRTDGGAYSENSLDGVANTGNNITTYYNEELEISRLIFDEIDKYIEEPDWSDYREIEYILALVEDYRQAFAAKGKSTDFLDLSKNDADDGKTGVGLAWAAQILKRDSWNVAWQAYEACLQEGTLTTANADKDELVPLIVRNMEKLPAPEKITTISGELRKAIIRIWKAYSLLNFGQLEMLGQGEEERILKYIALLDSSDDNEFVVGQQLANYPFIVYNDFEDMTLGAQAWQIADNKNAYSTGFTSANGAPAGTHNPGGGVYTMAEGWRHTKGFTTYTTNGKENVIDKDLYGYSPTDGQYKEEVMDSKLHYDAATVEVTDNGYLNTHAATMNIDSSFKTTSDYEGVFHTVTFSRDGKDANTYEEFKNNNTKLDNLGALSTKNATGNATIPLSLIMYVDFTEISDFYFSANIYGINGDLEHKFRVDMGNATLGNISDPDAYKQEHWKYYILHPDTGEWVVNHSTSQYAFTSDTSDHPEWNDILSLNGYKGYLMIPLYHIKSGDAVEGVTGKDKLDGNSDWLNSIYAIQFCIGGKNVDSLDGKSFTIDNIGFTYDPDCYSGVSHSSYAEIFNAKSLPAKQFEDAVKAIDPYDASTITTKYNEALAKYTALVPFQQNKVATAKAILDSYAGYANDTSTIPVPLYDPAQLTDFVNSLPESIRTTVVTGKTDIPYPGFTNGAVNYGSLGIDKTTAEEIIKHYNESYCRYTVTQKTTTLDQTVKEQFLNAYNMAMRMTQTLESIRTEVIIGEGEEKPSFLSEITGLYTVKYDYNGDGELENLDDSVTDSTPYKIGNFVSIEGRAFVEDFKDNKYEPLQYYSKAMMEDGSIYSQLEHTSRGFTYFLKNTETYNIDGEEIKGGILTFRDKLQTVYDIASEHIANRVRFSADELQYVKNILEEYNAFLPAYYNVEELYELEQAIIRLFSVSDISIMDAETDGSSLAMVTLNNNDEESMKDTAYVDLSYIAALLDTTVTLQAVSDLKLTQTSGTTFAELNSFTVEGLTADTPLTLGEYDNLYPDEVFARVPLQIAVDSDIAIKVPKDAVYEGEITFNVYETADIDAGLTGDNLVPIATFKLPVTFTGTLAIAYEVTIPATVEVDWDDSSDIDVSYSVKATLGSNTLSVGVSNVSNNGKDVLINDDTGITYELAYSKANFGTETFTGDVADGTKPTNAPSITVTGWDSVPVGAYSTQLTYTVDITS